MKVFDQIKEKVREVPQGKVATYGQIASLIGNPNLARQVGYAMAGLTLSEQDIPWWRVLNAKGYLSINKGEVGMEKKIQADLLRDEGIEVNEKFEVDLDKYLWIPESK